MRGGGEVIADILRDGVVIERVAKLLEKKQQLPCRKEMEQHQHIGLLGNLVSIRRIPFGFQQAIKTVNFHVFLTKTLPIEFLEVLVHLELADDTVFMKRKPQFAAKLRGHGGAGRA